MLLCFGQHNLHIRPYQAAEFLVDLPGLPPAHHHPNKRGRKDMPGLPVYDDDSMVWPQMPPERVGCDDPTDTATQDQNRLLAHKSLPRFQTV